MQPNLTPLARHLAKWKTCSLCYLHATRLHVVQVRGKIPCDILFVGEAPGESEDVIGSPFVGPAGQLLDTIIANAIPNSYKLAFTNLVACIPREDDGGKATEPDTSCIKACSKRLEELVQLAKPKAVVAVGKLAAKHANHSHAIIHPAALLRMHIVTKELEIQRCQVKLQEVVEDLQRHA